MQGKKRGKIVLLVVMGLLVLCALYFLFFFKNHRPANTPDTETDLQTAPQLVLDYNNVSLGVDYSFTVQAKVYWEGEEVKDEIEYTWELDENYSADIASMKPEGNHATITGLTYGDTAFIVSAVYRDTTLVKRISVCVADINMIFESPNMELSAGCYVVNLGLLETETDVTSMTPEIYVYDKNGVLQDPVFTWTNSDETVAVMDANWKISARKVGSTRIVGSCYDSEIHIQVNVHRSKVAHDPVYIEEEKNYVLSLAELKGTPVEDALLGGISVMEKYSKSSGSIAFDSDKLPESGVLKELVILTDKAELTMDAMVVTMAIYNEADLNRMPSVIEANGGEGYYALANHIECKGTYDAYEFGLTKEFNGTFDGRGYAIKNMTTSDRFAANRGLFGQTFALKAVLKNVAFVNASHPGPGAFIASNAYGTIENVYIQIDVTGNYASSSVLAHFSTASFSTKNVLIEYITPLSSDATYGYVANTFNYGNGNHQGLYVIGAGRVYNTCNKLGGGKTDYYGAYMTYGDFLSAKTNVSAEIWDEEFWTISNGIPYPKSLKARTGNTPEVSMAEYTAPDSTLPIRGITIFDKVTLSSKMTKLGIKLEGSTLVIPSTVPIGTKVTVTVQSVFDASKKVTLVAEVLKAEKLTLKDIYDAAFYGYDSDKEKVIENSTFEIDFGKQADVIGNGTIVSASVDGEAFTTASYNKGILTLDTSVLKDMGQKTVTVEFKRNETLVRVTIPIEVCTMSIQSEADLNGMPLVIEANKGEGYYVLANDIDCIGTYDAGAAGLTVQFNGIFNGRGYAIKNMTTSGRNAANCGLFGQTLGLKGVLKNVAFVNAKHTGPGGFIASYAYGSIENVYIQIGGLRTSGSAAILAHESTRSFSAKNVWIEYTTTPLQTATGGYAVNHFNYGLGNHQGLYIIGAAKVYNTETNLSEGGADYYGAYMTYGDFANAGINVSTWDKEFWVITNGIPYPKNLPARTGSMPEVSMAKYISPDSTVSITGVSMFDRVILGSDMTKLGITLEGSTLTIPKGISLGTTLKVTVQSVFDTSKSVTLTADVLKDENIILDETYDAVLYDYDSDKNEVVANNTFMIDLGVYADELAGTIVSVAVDGTNFTDTSYDNGVLTLDTESLGTAGEEEKSVTAVFKDGTTLTTVTIPVKVCTMTIQTEADLNGMPAVIQANDGMGYYVLVNDIECTGTYDAGAAGLTAQFKGIFDGRGYTIKNMTTANRFAANRGLFGQTFGVGGVLRNVSFVGANHSQAGGFIASEGYGSIENVYIQINVTGSSPSLAVLANTTNSTFSTKNVWIEYSPSLSYDNRGYAVNQLKAGSGKHQGLYVIGASEVYNSVSDTGAGETDSYGAYMTYGDFVNAGIDVSAWDEEFWVMTNGIPYPKNLPARTGSMPEVSVETVIAPGTVVSIEGATIYDRVILDSDMENLGITVSNNKLIVPNTVQAGTEIELVVQSVFDPTQTTTINIMVLESKSVTLNKTYDAALYGYANNAVIKNSTFTIDFRAEADVIGTGTIVSAKIDGTNFKDPSYSNGVLTLDATLLGAAGEEKTTVIAVFRDATTLTTVTIPIKVCTMAIQTEADLNGMPAVIQANGGLGYYVLANDIECAGTYDAGAAGLTAQFKGIFDGRGYTIKNMTTSSRFAANRGLFGQTFGIGGVLRNVSFVGANHSQAGGFIASESYGSIENVYIQISVTGSSTSLAVLANTMNSTFATKNVWVEYSTPLAYTDRGYVINQFKSGYGNLQGLYVIGANKIFNTSTSAGSKTDIYGAYMTYGDFINAGINVSTWDEEFWVVTNGIPYPKNLPARVGRVPEVGIANEAAPGTDLIIDGITMYDHVALSSEMKEMGITVLNNKLSIPETVQTGTEIELVVQSAFDTTKTTTISTKVLGSKNITLNKTYDAALYGYVNNAVVANSTFSIDFGAQASEIGEGTVVSATVGETSFATKSYSDGVLTLDIATLGTTVNEKKSATVIIKGESALVTVTIPIEVCTMSIQTEAEFNGMPAVIQANGGLGYYVLANDIECTGTYDAGAAGLTAQFKGIFDGRGYTIKNMTTSSRFAANRGLFGQTLGIGGVLRNVSFVGAKHSQAGGFIASESYGSIENVYIQISVTGSSASLAVLANTMNSTFATKNVWVEYSTPLAYTNRGYVINQYKSGYGNLQGLYVIGANKIFNTSTSAGSKTDIYGAYLTEAELLADITDGKVNFSVWANDFWKILDSGKPYPKKLAISRTKNLLVRRK